MPLDFNHKSNPTFITSMRTTLLLVLAAILLYNPVFAEDFPYATFTVEQMNMKLYEKDKTAHAVVLQEYGKTWISSQDGFPLIHEYHVKIKIFDSKAFGKGTVVIRTYQSDNNTLEHVKNIEGVTFYADEQGTVQRSQLDVKKVIKENENKYYNLTKFAMPNLRDGCIIEYKYTIESPYYLNFKNWIFQSDIPKMYSEYEARIPAYFDFKATLKGFYKLTKNIGEVDRNCFEYRGGRCDCAKTVYGIENLPAFKEEDYMTAPKNFISAVIFELNQYISPYDGSKHVQTQTWDDIDRNLKQHDEFGIQLRKTGIFKEKVELITTGITDDLAKAKLVYNYIRKNLKSNHFFGIWADNGIRKTLDTHSGNVADINMCLIAALNAAGINTDAVLLSTRDHGLINTLYPVVSDFNYLVAKANIGGKVYLLDATDELLPFGMLPRHCINGQGRVIVITSNKPSYWIDLTATEKKGCTYTMDLTLQPNGKLTGTVSNYSFGYEALEKRRDIKKFNNINEYVENLDEKMSRIKILKANITNVDSLELPVSEIYDVEIDLYSDMNSKRFAFNPYLMNKLTVNPFKLDERTYPVDMGTASDTKIILTLHLPDGYEVEAPPQNASMTLPNQGGKFITAYEPVVNGAFTFSHVIQHTRPVYSSEEYPYLKEFYNKIIQTQQVDILFKKK